MASTRANGPRRWFPRVARCWFSSFVKADGSDSDDLAKQWIQRMMSTPEQLMKNDLVNKAGVPASLTSRRKFIRTAAATGVAGIFSPGVARISARGSATKAAQIWLL